jgi:hypothetical protein
MEGEILSGKILKKLGVLTPKAEVVHIRGKEGVFLRSQFIDEKVIGSGKVYRGTHRLPQKARIDLRKLRALQVADLLIGNTDRHGNNIWFVKNPKTGLFAPVAFDHNFALGDKVLSPKWDNGATFSSPMSTAKLSRGAIPSKLTRTALFRNQIYQGALWNPDATEDYFKEAARLQKSLPNKVLKQMVAEIPDEAFAGRDTLKRREELLKRLIQRRDRLPQLLEGTLRGTLRASAGAVALDGLPKRLERYLPKGRVARTKLEMEIRGKEGFPRRGFQPHKAYGKLLEVGVPREAAREMAAILGRQAGLQTQASEFLRKSPIAPKARRPQKGIRVDVLARKRNYLPDVAPVTQMVTEEGGKLRGVGGAIVPAPGTPPRVVWEAAGKKLRPNSRQRLRIVPVYGAPDQFRAILQDVDGKVLREAPYKVGIALKASLDPMDKRILKSSLRKPNPLDVIQPGQGKKLQFPEAKAINELPAVVRNKMAQVFDTLRKDLKLPVDQAVRLKPVEVSGLGLKQVVQVRSPSGRWMSRGVLNLAPGDFEVIANTTVRKKQAVKSTNNWESMVKTAKNPSSGSGRRNLSGTSKKVPKARKGQTGAIGKKRLAKPTGKVPSVGRKRAFHPKVRVRFRGLKL